MKGLHKAKCIEKTIEWVKNKTAAIGDIPFAAVSPVKKRFVNLFEYFPALEDIYAVFQYVKIGSDISSAQVVYPVIF